MIRSLVAVVFIFSSGPAAAQPEAGKSDIRHNLRLRLETLRQRLQPMAAGDDSAFCPKNQRTTLAVLAKLDKVLQEAQVAPQDPQRAPIARVLPAVDGFCERIGSQDDAGRRQATMDLHRRLDPVLGRLIQGLAVRAPGPRAGPRIEKTDAAAGLAPGLGSRPGGIDAASLPALYDGSAARGAAADAPRSAAAPLAAASSPDSRAPAPARSQPAAKPASPDDEARESLADATSLAKVRTAVADAESRAPFLGVLAKPSLAAAQRERLSLQAADAAAVWLRANKAGPDLVEGYESLGGLSGSARMAGLAAFIEKAKPVMDRSGTGAVALQLAEELDQFQDARAALREAMKNDPGYFKARGLAAQLMAHDRQNLADFPDGTEFPCAEIGLLPGPDCMVRKAVRGGHAGVIYRAPDGTGHFMTLDGSYSETDIPLEGQSVILALDFKPWELSEELRTEDGRTISQVTYQDEGGGMFRALQNGRPWPQRLGVFAAGRFQTMALVYEDGALVTAQPGLDIRSGRAQPQAGAASLLWGVHLPNGKLHRHTLDTAALMRLPERERDRAIDAALRAAMVLGAACEGKTGPGEVEKAGFMAQSAAAFVKDLFRSEALRQPDAEPPFISFFPDGTMRLEQRTPNGRFEVRGRFERQWSLSRAEYERGRREGLPPIEGFSVYFRVHLAGQPPLTGDEGFAPMQQHNGPDVTERLFARTESNLTPYPKNAVPGATWLRNIWDELRGNTPGEKLTEGFDPLAGFKVNKVTQVMRKTRRADGAFSEELAATEVEELVNAGAWGYASKVSGGVTDTAVSLFTAGVQTAQAFHPAFISLAQARGMDPATATRNSLVMAYNNLLHNPAAQRSMDAYLGLYHQTFERINRQTEALGVTFTPAVPWRGSADVNAALGLDPRLTIHEADKIIAADFGPTAGAVAGGAIDYTKSLLTSLGMMQGFQAAAALGRAGRFGAGAAGMYMALRGWYGRGEAVSQLWEKSSQLSRLEPYVELGVPGALEAQARAREEYLLALRNMTSEGMDLFVDMAQFAQSRRHLRDAFDEDEAALRMASKESGHGPAPVVKPTRRSRHNLAKARIMVEDVLKSPEVLRDLQDALKAAGKEMDPAQFRDLIADAYKRIDLQVVDSDAPLSLEPGDTMTGRRATYEKYRDGRERIVISARLSEQASAAKLASSIFHELGHAAAGGEFVSHSAELRLYALICERLSAAGRNQDASRLTRVSPSEYEAKTTDYDRKIFKEYLDLARLEGSPDGTARYLMMRQGYGDRLWAIADDAPGLDQARSSARARLDGAAQDLGTHRQATGLLAAAQLKSDPQAWLAAQPDTPQKAKALELLERHKGSPTAAADAHSAAEKAQRGLTLRVESARRKFERLERPAPTSGFFSRVKSWFASEETKPGAAALKSFTPESVRTAEQALREIPFSLALRERMDAVQLAVRKGDFTAARQAWDDYFGAALADASSPQPTLQRSPAQLAELSSRVSGLLACQDQPALGEFRRQAADIDAVITGGRQSLQDRGDVSLLFQARRQVAGQQSLLQEALASGRLSHEAARELTQGLNDRWNRIGGLVDGVAPLVHDRKPVDVNPASSAADAKRTALGLRPGQAGGRVSPSRIHVQDGIECAVRAIYNHPAMSELRRVMHFDAFARAVETLFDRDLLGRDTGGQKRGLVVSEIQGLFSRLGFDAGPEFAPASEAELLRLLQASETGALFGRVTLTTGHANIIDGFLARDGDGKVEFITLDSKNGAHVRFTAEELIDVMKLKVMSIKPKSARPQALMEAAMDFHQKHGGNDRMLPVAALDDPEFRDLGIVREVQERRGLLLGLIGKRRPLPPGLEVAGADGKTYINYHMLRHLTSGKWAELQRAGVDMSQAYRPEHPPVTIQPGSQPLNLP